MTKVAVVSDYITPIKEILADKAADRQECLHRLIYRSRKILHRHLYKRCTVAEAVERLCEPGWPRKVRKFDAKDWQLTADAIWRKATELLGDVPSPEIILYPSFGRSNGRVYKIDGRLVIACSPDFPQSTGSNLSVILAHEYIHFARWRVTGLSSENMTVFSNIYEEGLATWLSSKLLPDQPLPTIFMCNLHKLINLADPPGGYLKWCQKNLKTIAAKAQRTLNSKSRKHVHCLFEGGRFRGDGTPVRTGYYLGYHVIEMLAKTTPITELFTLRPTCRRVSGWLDKLLLSL